MLQSQDSLLWTLAMRAQQIDPADLQRALAEQVEARDLDERTCVLIRDSVQALGARLGQQRVQAWLDASAQGPRIREICRQTTAPAGFSSLGNRVMEPTRPDTVISFLRELSLHINEPTRIVIGGSTALILRNLLSRQTEDIDVVDELPASVRTQHDVLARLAQDYGLQLAHFQSHYLPSGWEQRVESIGRFRSLDVYLVDAYDIAIGKLFSSRRKDRQDLRFLVGQLDYNRLVDRIAAGAGAWLGDPDLRVKAEENWYVLFGEALPG